MVIGVEITAAEEEGDCEESNGQSHASIDGKLQAKGGASQVHENSGRELQMSQKPEVFRPKAQQIFAR
jgi:hypothetical protein